MGCSPDVARLTVKLFDAAYAVEQFTLANDMDRQVRDVLHDAGSASLRLQRDDAQLPSIPYDGILQYLIDGTPIFAALVEAKDGNEVSQLEEAGEFRIIGGRGHVAEWEKAVWLPDAGVDRQPFVDSRVFNFAAFDFDDSGWAAPVATTPLYFDAAQRYAWPEGWPDNSAEWIWDRDSSSTGVPAGTVYFRRPFTLASAVRVQMWAACDDEYDVWLDGGVLFSATGFYTGKCQYVELDLDAGDHVLAVKATNLNNLRAGLLFTMIQLNTDGSYASVLTRSNTTTWTCLGYPGADPGMTPGEVVLEFFNEAQADGFLPGWSVTCTASLDSAGVAWPTSADIAFPVGQVDGLSMLRQLHDEGYIDWQARPGSKTLDVWVHGTLGGPSGVTLAEGTNLTAYVPHGRKAAIDELLSRYEQGYTVDVDAAGTANARGYLSIPHVRTPEEAGRIAAQILQTFRDERFGAEYSLREGLDEPWLDFSLGDTVTAPGDDGTNDTLRCTAFTYAENRQGEISFGGELGDLDVDDEARVRRWLRRMAGGTIGGRVESAGPVRSGMTAPTERSQSRLERFSFPGTITAGVISGLQTVHYSLRLVLFIIRATTAGSGDTTVRIYVDNVAHTDLTFTSGAVGEAEFVSIDLAAGQTIKVGIPTAGTGLADVVVEPKMAA